MSDARKPPGRPSNPGLPAVQPGRTTNPGMPAAQPGRASNPNLKVITAARTQPLPAEPQKALKERLKSGAEDAALNVVSILKDAYADFRNSDRYFKYKAGILAGWVTLSIITVIASCPPSELDAKNRLGARLAPPPADRSHPAITIFNDGDQPWKDVTIVVNGAYRAAVAQVSPHDAVTVTPKQLLGPDGKVAPPDLQARDVEIRTDDGKAKLMKGGVAQ